jgi:stearoyl-CoA desaturase (Delta-9 desaturase)
MSVASAELLNQAVVRLDRTGHRAKRIAASTTIAASGLGFAAAVVLACTGRVTTTDLVLFAVMYCVQTIGASIGLHRYLAHKTFTTSRPVEAVLMVAGAMALQGPVMFWVATHRLHHRFSDRLGDPHSPNLHGPSLRQRMRGLWWAHMPWMMSDMSARWNFFAPDILRDRRLFFFHRTYPLWGAAGLVLPALVDYAVVGRPSALLGGLVFGGLARAFVANQAAWCVGSVCHMFGSRPFRTNDRSANNWPVAVLTFGEGLQNNHHAFPGAYRHGIRWWEPDLSGWLLALMGRLRLVHGLRMPDEATVVKRRLSS